MAVYMAVHHRIGTLAVEPERGTTVIVQGQPIHERTQRVLLKFFPAWIGDPPGPDVIDTDKLDFMTVGMFEKAWGDDWKEKLNKYFKSKACKMLGIVPGDPRPMRPVKVTMTAAEFEEYQKQKPEAKGEVPGPGGKQKVVAGTRGTQHNR